MLGGAKIKLVGIGGTLRKASCKAGLLRAGLNYASTLKEVEAIHADFSKVPLYNTDLEKRVGDIIQYPHEVGHFCSLVASADAYLFALPEYNYSIPGVVKNAIDWASRPPNCFGDKPAVIMGAGGGLGSARSAYHLRQELFVKIFDKPSPFNAEGDLVDERTRERVHKLRR